MDHHQDISFMKALDKIKISICLYLLEEDFADSQTYLLLWNLAIKDPSLIQGQLNTIIKYMMGEAKDFYHHYKNKISFFMTGQKLELSIVMDLSSQDIARIPLNIEIRNYFLEEVEM